jgi:hypothetical protein
MPKLLLKFYYFYYLHINPIYCKLDFTKYMLILKIR